MALDPIVSLASIKSELEAGWKLFDDAWAGFGPADWSRKFGKTWTYAEIPYHLAYFDGMISEFLGYGPNVPADRKFHLRSMGDLDQWNAREFAKRPPGHTVDDSLRTLRATHDGIRRQLAPMTDADLERQVWMPLIFGWATARGVLQAIVIHNVAEYWKLWIRTGKKGPAPSPAAVHLRLGFMMNFMSESVNKELAARKPFTVVWHFDGPGGGFFTFDVANGTCRLSETSAPKPDLTLTMKPETFHKLVAHMTPPPLLMLTGQMKVKGLSKMGYFGKLFPEPKPDQIIAPSGGMAAG